MRLEQIPVFSLQTRYRFPGSIQLRLSSHTANLHVLLFYIYLLHLRYYAAFIYFITFNWARSLVVSDLRSKTGSADSYVQSSADSYVQR